MAPAAHDDALHIWFRSRGLPTLVPMRAWSRGLVRRVAPAVVFFAIAGPLLKGVLTDALNSAAEAAKVNGLTQDTLLLAVALVGAAGLGLALLAYHGVVRVLRRQSGWRREAWAWAFLVAALLALVYQVGSSTTVGSVAMTFLALLAVCFTVAWSGVGAFVTWAARAGVRHLGAVGQMASIALPVILMLVIFAFFSAEIWQLTGYLTWPRLGAFALTIAALGLLVVLRVSVSELDTMRERLTPGYRATLLTGTPGERAETPDQGPAHRLTRLQRMNLILVMSVAQMVLGGIFALTQAGLLIVLGKLTLTVDTLRLYLGPGTSENPLEPEPLQIGSHELPITVNLIKTAIFLGLLAALSFVVSSVSESHYRAEFFDPILVELHQAIAVYDAAALTTATGAATSPAPSEPADPPESPPENS